MEETLKRQLAKTGSLMRIPVFLAENGKAERLDSAETCTPLLESEELFNRLIARAENTSGPCILTDSFEAVYGALKTEEGMFLFGPVIYRHMPDIRRRLFNEAYHQPDEMYSPEICSLNTILSFASLTADLITGKDIPSQKIMETDPVLAGNAAKEKTIKSKYIISAVDEDRLHHTYQEEQVLLSFVREGNYEKASALQAKIDAQAGLIGEDDYEQNKNLAVVSVALCTRAAIEGGLKPSLAYKISDYYLQRLNRTGNIADISRLRSNFLKDLIHNINKAKNTRARSGYSERAKTYIEKHYREKIYLSDIADELGISESYLSRIFREETGRNIQDYITETRVEFAGNLLLFSNEPIARISEYVNFPSQSYFGRVFKKIKGMTPKEYRDRYQPVEVK